VAAAYDLAVIGGINGCGIARDAAGRGLAVYLCEMGDLAGGTSSRSTGLIHGGLRYLEHYEFRLVREALREREVLRLVLLNARDAAAHGATIRTSTGAVAAGLSGKTLLPKARPYSALMRITNT
jgi:glycerol-3-phosphate dehydrogenase